MLQIIALSTVHGDSYTAVLIKIIRHQTQLGKLWAIYTCFQEKTGQYCDNYEIGLLS